MAKRKVQNGASVMDDSDFNKADYYSVGEDGETLSHVDVADCIEEHLDNWFDASDRSLTKQQQVEKILPFKVYAWEKKAPSESWKVMIADHLMYSLVESWDEDYGNPEGSDVDEDIVKPLLRKAVDRLCDDEVPWQCDVTAIREFKTYADVLPYLQGLRQVSDDGPPPSPPRGKDDGVLDELPAGVQKHR
jgi:hypothetical protein